MEQRNKQAYRLAIKHYWQETLNNWKTVFPALLLNGIGAFFVLYVPPLIIAKLLAQYTDGFKPEIYELIPYILAFGGFWLLGELLWRLAIFFIIKAEIRASKSLYVKAINYILKKDLAFFHDNFAGSLTKKTVGYANRYIDTMDTVLYNVSPYVIPLLLVSFILWQFSPLLILVLIGMMALTLIVIIPMIRHRKKLVGIRESASNKVSGYISDIYSNIDAVRAFANEYFEEEQHKQKVVDYTKKVKRSWDFQNMPIDTIISPLYVLTNILGLVLSLHIALTTNAAIEVVFVTFSYYAGFTRFLWEFNGIYRRLETALSDAAQFTELLIDKPEVKDIENPKPFRLTRGVVEYKDVTFDHDSKIKNRDGLFANLNLKIGSGEKIGLVGHSGGGKTTLTKLLLRFMNVDSGAILIDGQDISMIRQSNLRQHIAYVPQDPYMFHRSMYENILYGRLTADDREVKHVAKLAHAHEFIKDMPNGYQTLVGERGVKLSGGQRQRVAIARAMLKNAPILVLDEATSALDSESEKLIQDALWKLMEGRTSIVIAHRLSTIQKMDRIVVLEDGEILEEGSHRTLLRRGGVYAKLWEHQSGGFLED